MRQQDAAPLGTIFFGGGTPSLLSLLHLKQIMQAIQDAFTRHDDLEISMEVNPGTLTADYAAGLRATGVNRISLGVQSMRADELQLLGRIHTPAEVTQAVSLLRSAGFRNINLDLIYGLPEQSLAHWQGTVRAALELNPTHLAVYALTLEEQTPLWRSVQAGKTPAPDPDLAADMYEWVAGFLQANGFTQYEISNWALTDGQESSLSQLAFACRHNLQYWRNLPYLGLGPGAHGYAANQRYYNVLSLDEYLNRMHSAKVFRYPLSAAVQDTEIMDPKREMQDTMMMGLRLTREGVSPAVFRSRFGTDIDVVFGQQIERLQGLGLLERSHSRVRITGPARLIANQVFREFV